MVLGVLNNISALYAENNLNRTQSSLQTVLQQLSSGSRINSGADDAAGLSLADDLGANEAALAQSAANATDGIGFLQTADGALAQVTNLMNRAVTLATESANGTLTSGEVSSANQEYQNILTEIGDLGSTTNFNGINVFSSAPKTLFESDGSSSGSNSYNDIVGALSDASVGLSTPSVATTQVTNPTPTVASTSSGSVTTFTLGAATDTLSGSLDLTLGAGSPHSFTFASGTTLGAAVLQLNGDSNFTGLGLSAAQGIGANANQLIITGPAEVTSGGSQITTPITNPVPTTSSFTLDSLATFTLGSSSDLISGTLNVSEGYFSNLSVNFGSSGITLAAAAQDITDSAPYEMAGVTASVSGDGKSLIIDSPSDSITPGYDTINLSGTSLNQIASVPLSTTNTQVSIAGTSLNQTSAAGAPGPGVNFTSGAVSTLSAVTAATVLTNVTTAISDVAYQRGILGASINELTAAKNVAGAEQQNLLSAQTTVMATNYGQATTDMSKYQILSQTGIAALAQANSVQQEVLKLLQ